MVFWLHRTIAEKVWPAGSHWSEARKSAYEIAPTLKRWPRRSGDQRLGWEAETGRYAKVIKTKLSHQGWIDI
jgi:hypothetical protein